MRYNIHEKKLDNGLKLFHAEVPSDDISIIANINAGPLYEDENNGGISHLVEHTIGKKTKKRPSHESIRKEEISLGGYSGWYTAHSNIYGYHTVILNDFEQTLDLISDFLYNSIMEPAKIEKEKKIILDEIRLENDDLYRSLLLKYYNELYSGSKLGRSISGNEETLKNMKTEDIVDFYNKMFTPANTTLFIVGGKSFGEVLETVEKYFKSDKKGQFYPIPKVEIPENKAREMNIRKNLEDVYVMLGNIVPPTNHKDFYALNTLIDSLAISISDRLLHKESISYDRDISYSNSVVSGFILAYASCHKKKYERLREIINDEFRKVNEKEIQENIIKDIIVSTKKGFLLNHSTTIMKAEAFMNFWLSGNIYEINSYIENFEKVTPEQVRAAAKKYICPDKMTCVTLGNL